MATMRAHLTAEQVLRLVNGEQGVHFDATLTPDYGQSTIHFEHDMRVEITQFIGGLMSREKEKAEAEGLSFGAAVAYVYTEDKDYLADLLKEPVDSEPSAKTPATA